MKSPVLHMILGHLSDWRSFFSAGTVIPSTYISPKPGQLHNQPFYVPIRLFSFHYRSVHRQSTDFSISTCLMTGACNAVASLCSRNCVRVVVSDASTSLGGTGTLPRAGSVRLSGQHAASWSKAQRSKYSARLWNLQSSKNSFCIFSILHWLIRVLMSRSNRPVDPAS